MKKLLLAASVISLLAACGGPSSDKATTEEKKDAAAVTGESFTIDTAATTVNWRATHKGGMAPRFGTIRTDAGSLSVENGALTAGNFEINLTSLTTDTASVTEAGKKSTDLDAHLKSPDFFDVAKYPKAKFVITKVAPYDSLQQKSLLPGATNLISGNLTLKDSTLNITFPAQVAINGNELTATAKFTIDRSAWGISYKTDGSPENWMISKDVEVGFNVKATKK
ncbi:YceI family protein [Chitinophaga qingshengii]|uniref:YceI family protein n=1 Tax=Chitinophaga qingshengii TaxID=1569794 RepID=A0ABR7TMV9_9BACT|nr:YceI family protein [Chitinophaga qingshengii]MBC9931819.1 YceI family protein [Chitinophaga qingshengii]